MQDDVSFQCNSVWASKSDLNYIFNSLKYCKSWNIYFATGWVEEWRRSEEQNIHSRMLRKVLPVFYWEHVDNGLLWVRVVDFRAYDYVPCKEIGNSNFDANALLGWWLWCSFSCKYVKTHEKFIYIKSFLFKLVVSVVKIIKLRRWLPLKQWLARVSFQKVMVEHLLL